MCHQNKLKRSFLKSSARSISMPGLPMKVGNSADMVWVGSAALLQLLASAAGAGTAAAANPVAAAPVKKLRRLKAARTFASHPATHISSPVLSILALHAILVVQSNIGNRRADAGSNRGIEIGCCRFRHLRVPKSGRPDFGPARLFERAGGTPAVQLCFSNGLRKPPRSGH